MGILISKSIITVKGQITFVPDSLNLTTDWHIVRIGAGNDRSGNIN